MMIPFGVLCAGVCVPADLDELEVCFGGTKSVFHRILLQDDALQWKKKDSPYSAQSRSQQQFHESIKRRKKIVAREYMKRNKRNTYL